MLLLLSALVLSASIVLGGGTYAGFLGDVWLQCLAIPLLLATIWAASGVRLLLIATFVGVLLLPLISLPQGIAASYWGDSPPGGVEARQLSSLSLTPQAGWASLVSLLPIGAIFLAVSQMHARQRVQLAFVVIFLGGVSAVIGFMQVAQGPDSSLRLYEITNPSEAVGFFANRNHFSSLLYVTLLLVSPWLILASGEALSRASLTSSSILQFAGICAFLLLLAAGLALARSRAGIFLAMAAVVGIGLVAWSTRGREIAGGTSRLITLGLLGFVTLFAAQFGFHRLQARFDRDPLEDLRVPFNATTLEAALANLPFGTGLGSFVPVYAVYEKAADQFVGFANRAHNDLLEVTLETGIVGIVFMASFAIWFIMRSSKVWWTADANLRPIDRMLQRVCTLCIVLLIAHSLVDYPLRTTAMGVIFAFCSAMLIPPPAAALPGKTPRSTQRQSQPIEPDLRDAEPTAAPKKLRNLAHMEWPQEWQSGEAGDKERGSSE